MRLISIEASTNNIRIFLFNNYRKDPEYKAYVAKYYLENCGSDSHIISGSEHLNSFKDLLKVAIAASRGTCESAEDDSYCESVMNSVIGSEKLLHQFHFDGSEELRKAHGSVGGEFFDVRCVEGPPQAADAQAAEQPLAPVVAPASPGAGRRGEGGSNVPTGNGGGPLPLFSGGPSSFFSFDPPSFFEKLIEAEVNEELAGAATNVAMSLFND